MLGLDVEEASLIVLFSSEIKPTVEVSQYISKLELLGFTSITLTGVGLFKFTCLKSPSLNVITIRSVQKVPSNGAVRASGKAGMLILSPAL